ncbi:phytanoyl-CoA dioxygenase family protein [Bacteriovoracaceae bacterium]|nr:phytanoyl-CoA dioxygenase family protein [Bacteriovoracaceae bacterium]
MSDLRENGYAVIENFLTDDEIRYFENDIQKRIENFEFEFPFVAQNRIQPDIHKKLIDSYFIKGNIKEVQFQKNEIGDKPVSQIIEEEKPSTIKLFNPSNDQIYWEKWLSPFLLPVIEQYLGMKPYLVEAYIRRNFPADYLVTNHQWHRDTNNPFSIIKVFFLFTDIKAENGPHHFVNKSHRDLRVNGKQYYENLEIKSVYPDEDIIKSILKKGTVIIEDTRGLHKAGIPTQGYRDLGYAVFVPLTFLSQRKVSYYNVDQEICNNLTNYQQKFIPKSSIS